jgi:hypothetical protein
MKLLNLSLDLLFNLNFTLEQLGEGTHDLIAALFDVMDLLLLNFLQKSGGYFLATLWNNEINKPTFVRKQGVTQLTVHMGWF